MSVVNVYSDGMISLDEEVTATAIKTFDINSSPIIQTFKFINYIKGCYLFESSYRYILKKTPEIEEHTVSPLKYIKYADVTYFVNDEDSVNTMLSELKKKDIPRLLIESTLHNYCFPMFDKTNIIIINKEDMFKAVLN